MPQTIALHMKHIVQTNNWCIIQKLLPRNVWTILSIWKFPQSKYPFTRIFTYIQIVEIVEVQLFNHKKWHVSQQCNAIVAPSLVVGTLLEKNNCFHHSVMHIF